MSTPSEWIPFFAAEVGATAALAGLVTVAISINLARILEYRPLVGRAAETLVMLVGALLASSLVLIPESIQSQGLEIALIALLVWAVPTFAQIRATRDSEKDARDRPLARFIISQITTVPAIAGGALLLVGAEWGYDWIATGILFTLVAGVLNTWVLLVEILR